MIPANMLLMGEIGKDLATITAGRNLIALMPCAKASDKCSPDIRALIPLPQEAREGLKPSVSDLGGPC